MTMVSGRRWRRGLRKVQAQASCVANNTAVTLHDLSTGRTAVIRKLHVYNANTGASTRVQLGTGAAGAFTQVFPDIFLPAGVDLELTEDQLLEWEFTADITVEATVAAAAPSNVIVMAEVEEFMGPSG